MSKIENAVIEGTSLGYSDHGFLTFSLAIKGNGWGVALGNIALDEYDQEKDARIPSPRSMELIAEVLHVAGVDSWEKLKGTYIRVKTHGLGSRISEFGNLIEEKWLDVDAFFDKEVPVF